MGPAYRVNFLVLTALVHQAAVNAWEVIFSTTVSPALMILFTVQMIYTKWTVNSASLKHNAPPLTTPTLNLKPVQLVVRPPNIYPPPTNPANTHVYQANGWVQV